MCEQGKTKFSKYRVFLKIEKIIYVFRNIFTHIEISKRKCFNIYCTFTIGTSHQYAHEYETAINCGCSMTSYVMGAWAEWRQFEKRFATVYNADTYVHIHTYVYWWSRIRNFTNPKLMSSKSELYMVNLQCDLLCNSKKVMGEL